MAYEIELKSLLGNEAEASRVRESMKALEPELAIKSSYKQLNHYFVNGDFEKLLLKIQPHIKEEDFETLSKTVREGRDFSVRTRQMNGEARLVLKASLSGGTSANGTARFECEAIAEKLSLDMLDKLLLDSGFTYQAKWSREREEYSLKGFLVTLDKNAGYGYVAEVEKVVESPDEAPQALSDIKEFFEELGIEELSQERLERMFAHYNKHWQEYYGTDKIFIVS